MMYSVLAFNVPILNIYQHPSFLPCHFLLQSQRPRCAQDVPLVRTHRYTAIHFPLITTHTVRRPSHRLHLQLLPSQPLQGHTLLPKANPSSPTPLLSAPPLECRRDPPRPRSPQASSRTHRRIPHRNGLQAWTRQGSTVSRRRSPSSHCCHLHPAVGRREEQRGQKSVRMTHDSSPDDVASADERRQRTDASVQTQADSVASRRGRGRKTYSNVRRGRWLMEFGYQ